MLGLSPRDLKRQMKRMGINIDIEELENARRVTIETSDKVFVVEDPKVVLMRVKGQDMIYVTGVLEEAEEEEEAPSFTEEDVQLVANQAGVSLDEARNALKSTNGDLAQAIMLLETKKRMKK